MRNSNVSVGAGIAGAVLFAAPALDLMLGAGVPDAVHAILGALGLALLASSAAVGDVWPAGDSRSRSYRRS